MSRYFSEAMNNHPEVARLRDKVRQLEQEVADLKGLNEALSTEIQAAYDAEAETKYRLELSEERNKQKMEKIRDYEELMETFNDLHPLKKMCYKFYYKIGQ